MELTAKEERRKEWSVEPEEDTHHQVEHGVHGEGRMAREEGLPEEEQACSRPCALLDTRHL